MGVEIERKYLVSNDSWRDSADVGLRVAQGYLSCEVNGTVRVRTMGDRGFLTIKGSVVGLVRPEFEYEIPLADAREILSTLTLPVTIDKTRYTVIVDGTEWVVDVFHGCNAPLVIAEVELDSPTESFTMPEWAGAEVTDDKRYSNSNLSRASYSSWDFTNKPV